MDENNQLIREISRIKKLNAEMVNQLKNLKYKNMTLEQNVERYKKNKKNKFFEGIGENKEKDIEAMINSSTTAINNQSNLGYPSSYSHQNSSVINTGILIANNSSESTIPSEVLPIVNNSKLKKSPGSLKHMRNKIYKPWEQKTFPKEKLLKFNEMKKIIEAKNDIIQRLITENDFLKKNFGMYYNNSWCLQIVQTSALILYKELG